MSKNELNNDALEIQANVDDISEIKTAATFAQWNPEENKKIATKLAEKNPERAKEIGSDYIVVGRPITQADDPVAAYERCVKEFVTEE